MASAGRPRGSKDRKPRYVHCTVRRCMVAIRPGGASLGEIIAFTGRPKSAVFMGLQYLIARGMVRRPRRAWYEPVEMEQAGN